MPKSTFQRLQSDKKEAFLSDAFAEFALRGFWGASLTQLVKSLGIAKGSLYQYFENKEEMYRFLIAEACRRKLAFFEALPPQSSSNPIFQYLVISVKFDLAFPAQGVIIYQSLGLFDIDFRKIIMKEFLDKIHLPLTKDIQLYKFSMIVHSQAILLALFERHEVDIREVISQKSTLKLNGQDILETIQRYLEINKITI